ncbi:MAG: hypothetical protein K6T88_01540 [Bacillus sp. (in: Bacteria)]|nr:hypothetical protein [Bacillus sp. (in: firmicutes)]
MIKKVKNFLLYLLISLLQFSGIIPAIVLEDLSSKKMGVARYLVFKKQAFETTYFTPFLIYVYTFIFVVGVVICLFLLITKGKNKELGIALLGAVIANNIGFFFIQFKMDLQAYHFFIIGFFLVIIFQYGWILKLFYCSIPKKE